MIKKRYEYKEIYVENIISDYKKGVLKVPRIQRNLVWKKEDKENLQSSMTKGYPIGVIFLFEDGGSKYILDGLQRTSTIVEIYQNAFENMSDDLLETNIKKSISRHKEWEKSFNPTELDEKKYLNFFKKTIRNGKWIRGVDTSREFSNTLKFRNSKEIEEEYLDSKDIGEISRIIYEDVVESLGIKNYQIPAITFDGNREEASEIFKLINTSGVKLINTDIWRATWSGKKVHISGGKEIIEKMQKSLKPAFDGLSISHEKDDNLTPYDIIWYIFEEVIGENWESHIAKEFTGIISKEKKSDKQINISSLIYIIKLYLYENQNDDLKNDFSDENIGSKISETINDIDQINKIIDNLKIAIKIFNRIFDFYENFKGNKKDKKMYAFMPKGSYIIAYLGSIFKKIIEEKEKFNQDIFIKKYHDSFIKSYIYDLLDKPFSSSSSKNAYKAIIEDKYYKDLHFDSFQKEIDDYFRKSKFDQSYDNFKDKSSILMAQIYEDIFKFENSSKNFQNDHLIPKSRLKDNKIIGATNFANLSIVVDSENNNKSDKIHIDILENESLSKWAKKNDTPNYELLKKSYLAIIDELNQKNYDDFLSVRKNIILERYKQTLFK